MRFQMPEPRVAMLAAGLIVIAAGGAGTGYFGYFKLLGMMRPAAALQCVRPAALTPSLFSDDQWTTIELSPPDLSDPRVLRIEPANTLPGMFSSLLALSPDTRRLAYVTASDELMDNAHLWYVDVEHPDAKHAVADIPHGLVPIRPAWSPDLSRLAFVVGRSGVGLSPGLELWEAHADNSVAPAKVGDLALGSFGRGKPMSLCWTADGQLGVLEVPPPPNGPPTPTPAPSPNSKNGGASCGLSVLSQNDPTWREEIMRTGGDAIGGFGCALTSTAMLLNYYGASLTPTQLNSCMGGAADPLVWAEAPRCGAGLRGGGREDFSWQALDGLLRQGRPAIVGMVRGITGMHFVVVTGGGGDIADNYRIADPWDGTLTKTLGSYTNTGYNPRWIVTYDGQTRDCARFTSIPPPVQGFTDGGTYRAGVTVLVPPAEKAAVEVDKVRQAQGAPPSASGPVASSPNATPSRPALSAGWTKRVTGSLRVDEEGTYRVVIRWRSGHAPAVALMKFTIDHTPPTVGLALLDPVDAAQATAPMPRLARPGKLRLTASDRLSGVDHVEYQLDGGAWVPYSDDVSFVRTLEVPQLGLHTISFRATDVAGNGSDTRTQSFLVVDTAAPPPSPPPPTSPPRNPTATPTLPATAPPFSVLDVTVTVPPGRCPGSTIDEVPFKCTFTVTVHVVGAKGQEVIGGTLTVNTSNTPQVTKVPDYSIVVQSPGESHPTTTVTVDFGFNCPVGTAVATLTQPPGVQASAPASFGKC